MKNKSATSFYISTCLFIVYLFCTQWGVSASFMGSVSLHSIFSILANCAWILSFTMAIYRIISGFEYYTRSRWFLFLSTAFIILLIFVAKTPSVVLPLFIGLAGLYANDRTLAKTIVITIASLLVMSYIFSLLGLNGGDVVSKPLFGADNSEYSVATAMGLANPNIAMALFANVVILSLFLCKTRAAYTLASIGLLVLTVILGAATGSTTGLVISILSIILMFAYKYVVGYTGEARYFMRKITPYMFAIVTIASLFVAVNYNPGNPGVTNDLLTNRPYLWNLRIENGSVLNLYGDNDQYQVNPESRDDNQSNHYPLDNEPLYIFVHYGLIVYMLFLYTFYSGSKRLKETELLVYVFVVCIAIFVGRITFYSFVFIFLEKSLAEYYLLKDSKKMKTSTGKVLM